MCGIILSMISACGTDSDIYLEEHEVESVEIVENCTEVAIEITEMATETSALYYVYICGAVREPGVYEVPAGSRIYEVISMAGGLLEEASKTAVNQAEMVSDGQMIQIYTNQEVMDMQNTMDEKAYVEDGRVNINTASVNELMTLPGIGEAKAEAIISYREEHGAFSDVEELKNIPGIKEGIFAQIKEQIKVDN